MDNEQIVNSIKNLCKSNNITITKLEEAIGLSQGLISRWAKSEPSLSKIIDIADYFAVSLDEVVGYKSSNSGNIEFIEKLIRQTDDETLKWKEDIIYESELIPPNRNLLDKSELEKRRPPLSSKIYTTRVFPTFIAIIARINNYIDEPERIELYIQPNKSSKYVAQNYTTKQLSDLWLRILLSLKEKAPDEIKAKEFISSFLNEDKLKVPKISLNYNNLLDTTLDTTVDYLVKIINTKEFKMMQETFSNPDFQATVQRINNMEKYKKD